MELSIMKQYYRETQRQDTRLLYNRYGCKVYHLKHCSELLFEQVKTSVQSAQSARRIVSRDFEFRCLHYYQDGELMDLKPVGFILTNGITVECCKAGLVTRATVFDIVFFETYSYLVAISNVPNIDSAYAYTAAKDRATAIANLEAISVKHFLERSQF